MKFIHLTDTHVIAEGRTLYGANPARRLKLAVESINREHDDAAFVVVTGDLTHWGDEEAYEAFSRAIADLHVPLVLMVGNHDDTPAFTARFPQAMRDENGFVQGARQTEEGLCLFLDTRVQGFHYGGYCPARLAWLQAQLEGSTGPVFLFMHHHPFEIGCGHMDDIRMRDHEAFRAVIEPHKDRIRHLFFGHAHRPIFGNWDGISFSCMRGLNHQLGLFLRPENGVVPGNLAEPAYGVVLVQDRNVIVHMHEFALRAPAFDLAPPPGVDSATWALEMKHPGFTDY